MSDHSHLLDDPRNADAIAAFVGARDVDKVVGLHDEVMVRDETVQRRSDAFFMETPSGTVLPSPFNEVRVISDPYPTVEVIMVTSVGRPYAKRYKMTLPQFLDAVHADALSQAS